MLRRKLLLLALGWGMSCMGNAQAADVQRQATPIAGIVVVVNDDVITRRELDERTETVVRRLKEQKTPLPPRQELEKQLLERMIIDRLLLKFAKDTGVRIDDEQLEKALIRIAKENKFASLDEFRATLLQQGVDFKKFREEIRGEMMAARVREREVDSKLSISDSEVDNYLATASGQATRGEEYRVAHIFVAVPEQASSDKIQDRKQRADAALAQLRKGADFAQVAAGFSDAKDALQGGDLGWRPGGRIPPAFLEVVQGLRVGQISEIMRSPNGFHILKLQDKRTRDDPVLITQTHARHILIKTSESVPDSDAKARLLEVKKRIERGASFGDQAKRYSEDGSAAQGGDLGWLSPGVTVPEFEKAMSGLQAGEMSGAVQTGFGWHLIQVLERRNTDISAEQKREQARQAIRSYKSDDAWQDWVRQMRDRAFVEYRAELAN